MFGDKLRRWEAFEDSHPASSVVPVRSSNRYDLSMHPSDPRGTFPGLPPFRVLYHPAEVLNLIIETVPSSFVTGWVGFLFGAAWSALIRTAASMKSRKLWLVTVLCSGIWLAALHRFLRHRMITAKPQLSQVSDVSSSPHGPCRVLCTAISVTNSHAGTHADTPYHFCPEPSSRLSSWDDAHYNGLATVIDISKYLDRQVAAGGDRAISRTILLEASREWETCDWDSMWRIILRTSSAPLIRDAAWSNDFAYFDISGAEFLASLSNLMLVCIDTPSVDHPTRSPICDGAHGVFFRNQIAIMENVVVSPSIFQQRSTITSGNQQVVKGTLVTCFHPTQAFDDSRGCAALFFPSPNE